MNVPTPETADDRLWHLSAIGDILGQAESAQEALPAVIEHLSRTLSPNSVFLVTRTNGNEETKAWLRDDLDEAQFERAFAHVRETHAYLTGSGVDLGAGPGSLRVRSFRLASTPRADAPSTPAVAQTPDDGFVLLPLVAQRSIIGLLQVHCPSTLVEADLLFLNAVVHQIAFAWAREAREAAASSLARLEARYRALVDSLDYAFVWEADLATLGLTYASASAGTLLGCPQAECLSGPEFWVTHVHADDRESVRRMLERARTLPGPQRCEHRGVTSDGRLIWFDTTVVRVDDDPTGPLLRGMSHDITPARDVRVRVRDQLDFARSIASGLGAGVIVVDQSGHIRFFNPAAERLLGMTEKQARRRTVNDVVRVLGADGRPLAAEEAPIGITMRTAKVLRNDYALLWRRSGSPLAVSYTVAPLQREGVVTSAVVVFQTVGELKLSEQRALLLSEVTASLVISLDRRSLLTAAGPILVPAFADICLIDEGADLDVPESEAPSAPETFDGMGHHAAWHWRQAGRLIEARVAETGESVRLPGDSSASASAATRVLDERTLATLEALGLSSVMVVPLQARERRRGTLTFLAGASRPPFEPADLAIAETLGERFGAALANARQGEIERAATRSRENLLAIVSHDLRSPLSIILTTLSALADDEERDSKDVEGIRTTLAMMTRAATRMHRLLDALLDAESVEKGTLATDPRPVQLGAALEEAFLATKSLAERAGVTLHPTLPLDLPEVQADVDRVVQVVTNLTENAIKFTPRGGQITLGAERRRDSVRFWVRDTGQGIAASDVAHVFERSWQVRSTARAGHGLGLFISKAIIESHLGELAVESTPGEGSVFSFTLPLANPPPVANSTQTAPS